MGKSRCLPKLSLVALLAGAAAAHGSLAGHGVRPPRGPGPAFRWQEGERGTAAAGGQGMAIWEVELPNHDRKNTTTAQAVAQCFLKLTMLTT